jgi:hypothetical protein
MDSKEVRAMGSIRGGRARWAAAMLGLAVGAAALLGGSTGVAQAGGPVTAQSPNGVYTLGPLPRPGASQGVVIAPDPRQQGDPRDWRGSGRDDWRGHSGNWRHEDWRHDNWQHYGYWHGGRWYPYRYYGYSGYPAYPVYPAYPGQWVWDGWRWVWVPAY